MAYLQRTVVGSITIDGLNIPNIVSLSVKEEPSKPLSWHAVFLDDKNINNLADYILEDPIDGYRTVNISIVTESGTRKYNGLILLDGFIRESNEEGIVYNILGTDASFILEKGFQTKITRENISAKEVLSIYLTEAGLIPELTFHDFTIQQIDFQEEKPISVIQTLLDEAGAEWRVEGKRFITWIPMQVSTNSAWDGRHLYVKESKSNRSTYYNIVKATRTTKNADLAGALEGFLLPHTDLPDMYQKTTINISFSGIFYGPTLRVNYKAGCTLENPITNEVHITWLLNDEVTYSGKADAV